jgi:hypothetical protein
MNDERDDDLRALLKPLHDVRARPEQIDAWRQALHLERARLAVASRPKPAFWRWAPIFAALTVGFLVGALTMRKVSERALAQNSDDNSATVEVIYAKAQ